MDGYGICAGRGIKERLNSFIIHLDVSQFSILVSTEYSEKREDGGGGGGYFGLVSSFRGEGLAGTTGQERTLNYNPFSEIPQNSRSRLNGRKSFQLEAFNKLALCGVRGVPFVPYAFFKPIAVPSDRRNIRRALE